MAGLHASQRGNPVKMNNNPVVRITRETRPQIRRSVTVFECVFCRTSHYMESSSGSLRDAHQAISDLLDAGCNKCGGKVTFKEHRHISDDALNGRR